MESQTTQTFSLTPEQNQFVKKCIASGHFKSTDKVVKEGVNGVERGEWVETAGHLGGPI